MILLFNFESPLTEHFGATSIQVVDLRHSVFGSVGAMTFAVALALARAPLLLPRINFIVFHN